MISIVKETVIAIFKKDDFKNPAVKYYGNIVFTEEEIVDKLRKIFNSPLKDEIESVVIAQVNNKIDSYQAYDNFIQSDGNWSQACSDLYFGAGINTYEGDFYDDIINKVNNAISDLFPSKDHYDLSYNEDYELEILLNEDYYNGYEMSNYDKMELYDKINKAIYPYSLKSGIVESYGNLMYVLKYIPAGKCKYEIYDRYF